MALDRTLTWQKRRVDIYLPSLETRARWVKSARELGLSLSEMVYHMVEGRLAERADPSLRAEGRLAAEAENLGRDLATARKRIEELEAVNSRLEREADAHRTRALLGEPQRLTLDPRIARHFQEARGKDRRPRLVEEAELRHAFQITPKDTDRLRALASQIELLELHGFVTKKPRGWVWNG